MKKFDFPLIFRSRLAQPDHYLFITIDGYQVQEENKQLQKKNTYKKI